MLPTTQGEVGSGSVLFAFPQIILYLNEIPFATSVLQKSFYQFYEIGTSLNIIQFDQTLHGATPGLGLQCSPSLPNLRRAIENAGPHSLIPVTDVK